MVQVTFWNSFERGNVPYIRRLQASRNLVKFKSLIICHNYNLRCV